LFLSDDDDEQMTNVLQADGVFLDYHDRGRTLKLTIRNLNPSNAGTYTCRANNSIGRDEASSTVVVECMLSTA